MALHTSQAELGRDDQRFSKAEMFEPIEAAATVRSNRAAVSGLSRAERLGCSGSAARTPHWNQATLRVTHTAQKSREQIRQSVLAQLS